MTKVAMPNVKPAVREENERRGREEQFHSSIPVELICGAYKKGDSHYGKFTVRILDPKHVEFLRRLYGDVEQLGFAVHLAKKGKLLSVKQHEMGWALSGNEIQVTTMARMNAADPETLEHFMKLKTTLVAAQGDGRSWTVNIPTGFVTFQDNKCNGTKTRKSAGRGKGGKNSSASERREVQAVEASVPAVAEPVAPVAEPGWKLAPSPMVLEAKHRKFFPSTIRRRSDECDYKSYPPALLRSVALRELSDKEYAGMNPIVGEFDLVDDKKTVCLHIGFRYTAASKRSKTEEYDKVLTVVDFTLLEKELIMEFIDALLTRNAVRELRKAERERITQMRSQIVDS